MTPTKTTESLPCNVCYGTLNFCKALDKHICQDCFTREFSILTTAPLRGGKRKGSGRKKGGGKWGDYQGELKRVYVPEPISEQLPEFVQSVVELLENFDAMTADYPDSPRKKLARQLVEELKDVVGLIQ